MSYLDLIELEPKKETLKRTYIAFVVDESSSMWSLSKQAISLFNENIKTAQIEGDKNKIETLVTFIKFSSKVNIVYENKNIDNVDEIDENSYSPNGCTAMYDGIGTAINKLKSISSNADKDDSFLIVVITDGEENSSVKFSAKDIYSLISELESTKKWTFTVLGSNIDFKKLSEKINIQPSNIQRFESTLEGIAIGSQAISNGLQRYYTSRSEGMNAISNFYENRNENMGIEETLGRNIQDRSGRLVRGLEELNQSIEEELRRYENFRQQIDEED